MARRRPISALHAPVERRSPLVDPRGGDIEADASSPDRRSLLAIAGNLLAEISLPKLAAALSLLVVLPALLLGAAPLLASVWLSKFSSTPNASVIAASVTIVILIALAWFGGRPLLRVVESSFWSLNAMAIQPVYVACREGLLHLGARATAADATEARKARARAVAKILSGIMLCALSLLVIWLVWPSTRWVARLGDLRAVHRLVVPALANATVLVGAYLAIAALAWGIADGTMPQPRELTAFRSPGDFVRSWRVAHLSDLHVVGERFGFRLGSGRAGPKGNGTFLAALRQLDELHRRAPLDAIVITGDLTDAGTSAEWAVLLEALEAFPRLTELMIAVPGNHDVNVVDRANPARLDLPTSPKKRLRQVRTLSLLAWIQGRHTCVVDVERKRVACTLDGTLAPYACHLRAFANKGSRQLAKQTDAAWQMAFPMVWPPAHEDGLGIVALNSNAETHFSFTNALGLVPADQVNALDAAIAQYPRAAWIVALHHHVVEHPKLGHAFAERIGTTLINGNWFVRRLLHVGDRAVVMHGHRHIDWMGECGDLRILSAPASTMPAKGRTDVYFYVHTVGVDGEGRIGLAKPDRVDVIAG